VRRMLINAQRADHLRLAVISNGTLDEYQVAVATAGLTRGNIYRATVASIKPALDAAFVDYGVAKDGLLARHDVVQSAYHHHVKEDARRPRIDQVLERGRSIVVQVTREPVGAKGGALTTNLSLAGRYLVLMPYDDTKGISRKVEDEEVRQRLRELADSLTLPEGCGVIVRTNALDQNKASLNRDLSALLRIWKRIRSEAERGKGPKLLYSDQDLIVQAVRDYLDSSIDEVLVDDDHAFDQAQAVMRAFMPRAKTRLVRYRERVPLFSRFELEDQIETIFKPRTELPSGGSLVIESTEALTAIDVNSGRSLRGAGEEDTAYRTNLEAAGEVARQLRLRDIGGLIVVDFIDMRSRKHRGEVEKAMREAHKTDRARTSVGRISPNGLLEINRQRLRSPLVLRTHRSCPTCGGTGKIPSPETVSMGLLRRIEERAAGGGIAAVRVALHPELADALQNHYRQELAGLEREFGITIEVIAATSLHRSQEQVSWTEGAPTAPPAPPSIVMAGGDAAPAPEPEAGTEEAQRPAESKSRRRRRGGRKHRKRPAEDSAEVPAAGAEVVGPPAESPQGEESGVDGERATAEDGAAQPAGAPRPRSSRRRKKRRRPSKKTEPEAASPAPAEQPS
jgi:ribonuclease E